MEDCIFLGRIQELRDEADDEDEGLRYWLLEQMKLYWSMEDEGMDHAGDHGEDDEDDEDEA